MAGGPTAVPRFRDYAWGGFAILVGVLSAVGVVNTVISIASGDVEILVGVAVLLVGSLAAYWIAMGAWRRTIWGPPPPPRPGA